MRTLIAILFSLISITSFAESRYLVSFESRVAEATARRALESSGFEIERFLPEIDVYFAHPTHGVSEVQALRQLKGQSAIRYIEKDQRVWQTSTIPNDPEFTRQSYATQIQLAQAWSRSTGDRRIVVAVTDTGFDFEHPDLRNQLWENTRELPGNGIDDDDNGYVDDVHGWDFVDKDGHPEDENGHGTHVSGIIGAEGNNGIGVAGVSWNVRIMPLKFLGRDGRGNTSDGLLGLLYAVNQGARVVNASWGSSLRSSALRDALRFAATRGVLVVCAAGNSGQDTDRKPQYPSSYEEPSVLSVAATAARSELTDFSNFGVRTVHVAAPGSAVFSTFLNGGYRSLSGTSMAAPVVTGVAALMLSVQPQLDMLELRNGLMNAVTQRTSLVGRIGTEGEINVLSALNQLDGGSRIWPSRLILKKGQKFQFSAYRLGNEAEWSVADALIGRISAQGEFEALAAGETQVMAQTSSGQILSTEKLVVVEESSGGGSGCHYQGPATPLENFSSVTSTGFPLIFGLLWHRRRRRRHVNCSLSSTWKSHDN